MRTAVIIPTVGRTFFVHNIVLSLLAGTRRPDEIIVVDQTAPSERNPLAFSGLKALEEDGLCRIVQLQTQSLTHARNVGIDSSGSDLLIFVDDDAFIPKGFVEAYEAIFEDPSTDAATGMILVSESDRGTIDTSVVHPSQHDGQTMLRGGNFAVRRSVINALGGLDENLIGAANHEDADLAFRLHRGGYKVIWSPSPWLFHLSYSAGGGRIANPHKHRNFAQNLCYFYLRHYHRIDWPTLRTLLRWRVFNRENVTRPWRLVPRLADFYLGYRLAKAAVMRGPNLPLLKVSDDQSRGRSATTCDAMSK